MFQLDHPKKIQMGLLQRYNIGFLFIIMLVPCSAGLQGSRLTEGSILLYKKLAPKFL